MTVTFTDNYRDVLDEETVKVVDELVDCNYELPVVLEVIYYFGEENADCAGELIDAIYYTNSSYDELYEFVDKYGYRFIKCFADYYTLVKEHCEKAVGAFINCFDVSELQSFEDAYLGYYDTVDDFVAEIINESDANIPHWVVIDYQKTWNSILRFEFTEDSNYYFRNI
jgi:hypothetical protein